MKKISLVLLLLGTITSCTNDWDNKIDSRINAQNKEAHISTKSETGLIVPNLVNGMLSFRSEDDKKSYLRQILDMGYEERKIFEKENLDGFVSQKDIYLKVLEKESKLVNPQIDSLKNLNIDIDYASLNRSELFLEKERLGLIVEEVSEDGYHSLQIGGDIFLSSIANENGKYLVADQLYINNRASLENKPAQLSEGVRSKAFAKKFFWGGTPKAPKYSIFRVWVYLDIIKKSDYYWEAKLSFIPQLQDLSSSFATYYSDDVILNDMDVSGYYTYANPLPPYGLERKQLSYKLKHDRINVKSDLHVVTYPIPHIDPSSPELVFANVILPSGVAQIQPIADVYTGLEFLEFGIPTEYRIPYEYLSISLK